MNQSAVKLPTYSSLTAFLEHYRALESLSARSADEEKILDAMKKLVGEIGGDATMVLAAPSQPERAPESGTDRRHRERAEIHLRRELAARGIVTG